MGDINAGLLCLFRMALGSVALILSACSYQGGSDHPVIKKFTWFSYIGADDIRKNCNHVAGPKYRFVYNGIYNEQIRTYDISKVGEYHYKIKTSVTEDADLSSVKFHSDDLDLLRPWRPKTSVANVGIGDINMLTNTLMKLDSIGSSPPLKNLPSINFYWVVSACIDGHFHQNGYLWPSKEFNKAEFPKLLKSWDFTGIPLNPPRKTSDVSVYGTSETKDFRNHFNLKFSRNGLLDYKLFN